ncbi:Holin of 3TMs, for gene-transfer release OS=Bosea thiooxidans OX=53254 GN=SAMN05660750_03309 PE=4 SV=1 [Bosea thiooxidans]
MNDLIKAVIKAGGPLLGTVIGGPVGTLAGAAIGALAEALGTPATPEAVKQAIETKPGAIEIVKQVEAVKGPELYSLLAKEAENYAAIISQDAVRGWFYTAWRPAGMWLVLAMWPFAVILGPVLPHHGAYGRSGRLHRPLPYPLHGRPHR